MTDTTRGVLYPERLPRFTRLAPPAGASDLIAWFWIPQWDLADGVESRQPVLAYPAANLVVEPDGVTLWGATTRLSERVLRGSGWAVGALLRPAALVRLHRAPSELVDTHVALYAPHSHAGDPHAGDSHAPHPHAGDPHAPRPHPHAGDPHAGDLHGAISGVMPDIEAAVGVFAAWLAARVGPLTSDARLANDMADLLMTAPAPASSGGGAVPGAPGGGGRDAILRVDDAAERLRVSVRTLQRLAHRTVGLPPAAMIRRRRLQEAAQRVRDDPDASLADIAAEFGYADQAHLANDFRAVLGFTATDYRAER